MSKKNDYLVINPHDTNENYSSLAYKIKKELVDNTYYNDVKKNLKGRSNWKYVADIFEVFSKIFIGLASVLAFASGFFGYTYMSFISGCLSILSLIFLQFSSYAMKESKERNEIVNKIFKKIGLDEMVDISTDPNDEDLVKVITSDASDSNDKSVKMIKSRS